jgi:hypothetical protein
MALSFFGARMLFLPNGDLHHTGAGRKPESYLGQEVVCKMRYSISISIER